jgi:subtilisin family serine protease
MDFQLRRKRDEDESVAAKLLRGNNSNDSTVVKKVEALDLSAQVTRFPYNVLYWKRMQHHFPPGLKMRRRAMLFAFLFPALTIIAFGGVHKAAPQTKKALPLDKISGVRLKNAQNSLYMTDRIIVRLKTPEGIVKQPARMTASLRSFLSRYYPTSVENMFPPVAAAKEGRKMKDMSQFLVVKLPGKVDPFKIAAAVSQHPDVLYAEPWFYYKAADITRTAGCAPPNDLTPAKQWGLIQIEAEAAWCVQQGDTDVVIGIVDTGVEWTHPDLTTNIWYNPGEMGIDSLGRDKRFNGIDDDHDGYVDDWHGWDFAGDSGFATVTPHPDNNPDPDTVFLFHGTHVAGIAAAATNNGIGIAGAGYKCRILPIKTSFSDDNQGPYIYFGFQGLLYAAQMGAKVANCSWGDAGASNFEQEIIDSVTAMGMLVVAAAGNDAPRDQPVYPAAYAGVLDVAATSNQDVNTYYTHYGYFVDCAAPGGTPGGNDSSAIFSTYYPNTYGLSAGTSMASPHAAGVAALVASQFPSYTPAQIKEQVRVTSDSIAPDGIPQYTLGHGRVNAYNAVTESSPSIRITSITVRDTIVGNGNGVLEPNETFALAVNLENYLAPTTSATRLQLVAQDGNVTVMQPTSSVGSLGTFGTGNNNSAQFAVKVSASAPQNSFEYFTLLLSNGSYVDNQSFQLALNPTYATMQVNNIGVTFMPDGRIGFNDYGIDNEGVGFTYHGLNQLYEAGLVIGTSPTTVVDCVRNDSTDANGEAFRDADFAAIGSFELGNVPVAALEGSTTFTDADADPASSMVGVSVYEKTFQFKPAPDTNYVIVRYDISNTTAATLTNLYAGVFCDWDILPNYATNLSGYDSTRKMGWATDLASASNSVFCGVRALDSTAATFHAIDNNEANPTFSKNTKWNWLSGGNVFLNHDTTDISFVVANGPFSVAPNSRVRIGMAMIAGNSLADLQRNSDFAAAKWPNLEPVTGVKQSSLSVPKSFLLRQNYPNPFNPTTTISYDLPRASLITLSIFNVLGQHVATLIDKTQSAGTYTATFNANNLGSGVYFYRLTALSNGATVFNDVKKLVLIK